VIIALWWLVLAYEEVNSGQAIDADFGVLLF